jgi:hypothetical protein
VDFDAHRICSCFADRGARGDRGAGGCVVIVGVGLGSSVIGKRENAQRTSKLTIITSLPLKLRVSYALARRRDRRVGCDGWASVATRGR